MIVAMTQMSYCNNSVNEESTYTRIIPYWYAESYWFGGLKFEKSLKKQIVSANIMSFERTKGKSKEHTVYKK